MLRLDDCAVAPATGIGKTFPRGIANRRDARRVPCCVDPEPLGRTDRIATELADRYAIAEAYLWLEMNGRGLRKQDGWTIVEFMRDSPTGMEIVLRPLHLYRPTPPGIECVIQVDDTTGAVATRWQAPGASH